MTGVPIEPNMPPENRSHAPTLFDDTDTAFAGTVEYVPDAGWDRRSFLRLGLACAAAVTTATSGNLTLAEEDLRSQQITPGRPDQMWGVGLAYGEQTLDLIDLDASKLLHSFDGLRATHAITPLEHLNRFVVHGLDIATRQGAVGVLQVDPVKKTWSIPFYETIPGGPALHWQPDPNFNRIVFNTIGDGGLHVLDTAKLTMKRYDGGGGHSNMAFLDDYLVATDDISGLTNLSVVNLKTGKIESKTPVGYEGHGVTTCRQRGEAFVWANDGVHVVSLAKDKIGKHMGIIQPHDAVRCWFCWTPQGGQYSHDVTWAPRDDYQPHLLVTDMENHRFEKIPTGDPELKPSYLQLSPDGKWGLSSLRGRKDVAIFDTQSNTFRGTVKAGPARRSFFERDMAFCRNRDCAIVTNTGDNTISLLDLTKKVELRRISLPRRPLWFKSISPQV